MNTRDIATQAALTLSREHGPMAVVRLDWTVVTGYRRVDVDQEEPCADRRRTAYAAIPAFAMRKVDEADAPRAALLGLAVFDVPMAHDDRYRFARSGHFRIVDECRDGQSVPVSDYDPFADEPALLEVAS